MDLARFDIVIVELDPTVGSEIRKTRPCIVVSPEELVTSLRTVVVVPLTSQLKSYPYRVSIKTRIGTSQAVPEQIRTVDKSRIRKRVGKIRQQEISALTTMLRRMYVD